MTLICVDNKKEKMSDWYRYPFYNYFVINK